MAFLRNVILPNKVGTRLSPQIQRGGPLVWYRQGGRLVLFRGSPARCVLGGWNEHSMQEKDEVGSHVGVVGVVWFRRDLRVGDHGGLEDAFRDCDTVEPVYVMDEADDGREEVKEALWELASRLQTAGSGLRVVEIPGGDDAAKERRTSVIDALRRVVQSVHAEKIYVEEDFTEELQQQLRLLRDTEPDLDIVHWTCGVDSLTSYSEHSDIFSEFRRQDEFRSFFTQSRLNGVGPSRVKPRPQGDHNAGIPGGLPLSSGDQRSVANRRSLIVEENLPTTILPCTSSIGEESGLAAVERILQVGEAYNEVDVFRSLEPYLRLGCISPSQIIQVVHVFERGQGRPFRFLYRDTARRLLNQVESQLWHGYLAQRDRKMLETWYFWKWNGLRIRYCVAGAGHKTPLLLVHGFGASITHWEKNIEMLAQDRKVYALDMVGYGRSEKPQTQFTSLLWESNIRDFVEDVIGEPVLIAGNSIGGYVSLSFASNYPSLCRGVILVNSAGRLLSPPEYEYSLLDSTPVASPPPSLTKQAFQVRPIRMAVAQAILFWLQGNIERTLRRVYPVRPDSISETLAREIFRNSCDPGAAEVLGSGFILPPPRPMNALLANFSRPMLIYQGVQDPLNDSRERALRLHEVYPQASIYLSEAGHCPHDECPNEFNAVVREWMLNLDSNTDSQSASVELSIASHT
eukprot:CAMPEP_0184690902 /NCGR_PEP_ID=MMETSP0312-20130426/31498_1 /TAXON_ID=31354 /ORGANISM="Compsopogon coeruleus, Strain SAG 36.94" /LENGTH=685 /DNA_ID=CAMNT_0027148475 /DNA_START=508 /DNA_END=2565 /DNA_ORIENTATION=+